MRDEQEPTLANESDRDAEELKRLLAQRIKVARVQEGLSQQAVADAMKARGFSWRQTTVAKAEAADRPTLFTEVVALSSVLKKELSFFLTGHTNLDTLKERLRGQVEHARMEMAGLQAAVENTRRELERVTMREGVALSITEYTYTVDGGALKDSVEMYARLPLFTIPELGDVLEIAGVPVQEVESADAYALRVAAEALQRTNGGEGSGGTLGISREGLLRISADYLSERRLSSKFLDVLRRRDEYREEACRLLVDSVLLHVLPRDFR